MIVNPKIKWIILYSYICHECKCLLAPGHTKGQSLIRQYMSCKDIIAKHLWLILTIRASQGKAPTHDNHWLLMYPHNGSLRYDYHTIDIIVHHYYRPLVHTSMCIEKTKVHKIMHIFIILVYYSKKQYSAQLNLVVLFLSHSLLNTLHIV